MFARLDRSEPDLAFRFDGREIRARAGETVAEALLAAGVSRFGASVVSGAPRGPYCMMGACFQCLVEIDGQGTRRACLAPVRAGMRVASRDAPPAVEEAGS